MNALVGTVLFTAALLALLINAARQPVRSAWRTWREFRKYQRIAATPLGQAYVAGLADNVARLERGLDFATWDDQITQGGTQ